MFTSEQFRLAHNWGPHEATATTTANGWLVYGLPSTQGFHSFRTDFLFCIHRFQRPRDDLSRASCKCTTSEPKREFMTAERRQPLKPLEPTPVVAPSASACCRRSCAAAKRFCDLWLLAVAWNRHQAGFCCHNLAFAAASAASPTNSPDTARHCYAPCFFGKLLAFSGSMSLNESRTPGRAPLPIPLRPHHQGGSLKFDGESQPVSEPNASTAKPITTAIGDFIDEQCEGIKRFERTSSFCRAVHYCAFYFAQTRAGSLGLRLAMGAAAASRKLNRRNLINPLRLSISSQKRHCPCTQR
jgi:hypothetical protein